MRYIYLLLITFIFASCGNQKMRFVRNNSTKQKVVEIADIPSLKKKSETAFIPEHQIESTESEETPSIIESSTSESDESSTKTRSKEFTADLPISVNDSTSLTSNEVDAITQEALRAEQLGTYSLTFGLLFYVFTIAAFVCLILALNGGLELGAAVAAIIFGIIAVVSTILGLVFGIKSLNAPYNTPKGKRRAIAGIVISGIALLLLLLNVGVGLI